MTAGSVLGVVALVVIAASPDQPVFVGGWVFAGVAMAGVLYPPAFAAITGWFTARRLGALATLTLVAGLASTVFAPLAATAGEHLGWRATYLWSAVVLAVLTVRPTGSSCTGPGLRRSVTTSSPLTACTPPRPFAARGSGCSLPG